jgi:hypothetical protein
MLMHKTRRRRHRELWDLFHPRPQRPTWEELPQAVVRRVTELLARLLHEQREGEVLSDRDKELSHE